MWDYKSPVLLGPIHMNILEVVNKPWRPSTIIIFGVEIISSIWLGLALCKLLVIALAAVAACLIHRLPYSWSVHGSASGCIMYKVSSHGFEMSTVILARLSYRSTNLTSTCLITSWHDSHNHAYFSAIRSHWFVHGALVVLSSRWRPPMFWSTILQVIASV